MLYAFEGVDGAGKSTVIQKVAEKLENQSKIFKFPSFNTRHGSLAKEESDPYLGAIYFLLDMKNKMDKINEALDENQVVLIDRFWLSTVVYAYSRMMMEEEIYISGQEYASDVFYPEKIEHLFEWLDLTIEGLSLPDPKVIYLDLGGSQYDALNDDQVINSVCPLDQNIQFQRLVYLGYQIFINDWIAEIFHYNVTNSGRRIDLDILATTIASDIQKDLNRYT